MKRLFGILALLLFSLSAQAQSVREFSRAKNIGTYIPVVFMSSATWLPLSAVTTPVCSCQQYTDGSAPATLASCTNTTPVEEATTTGIYFLQLAAADITSEYTIIKCTTATASSIPFVATVNTTLDARSARDVALAVTMTSATLAASESFNTRELEGNTVFRVVGATNGAGQTRCITKLDPGTGTVYFERFGTLPTGVVEYSLDSAPNCDGHLGPNFRKW